MSGWATPYADRRGPGHPTIQLLLRHVRGRGFDLAPEPRGFDDEGREVVTYLPGTTVGWTLPWPDLIRDDDLLAQVGAATARYHRAVADFRPTGVVPWQSGPAPLGATELVCHHDLAPYNVVVAEAGSWASSTGISPARGALSRTWRSWPGSGSPSTGLR